ncbi:Flp pilus assembly complex ATPase component TadA [Alcaligenaceae bacterium]|nr:Flp pilus assembly complex ATPase component TadA [Alcaligenaceae bacterium]
MLELDVRLQNGTIRRVALSLPLDIGRAPECGLTLKSWRVARRHARIELRAAGMFIVDTGTLIGTFVNERHVADYGPLQPGDEIMIGPYLLRIHAFEEQVSPSLGQQACTMSAQLAADTLVSNNQQLAMSGPAPSALPDLAELCVHTQKPISGAEGGTHQSINGAANESHLITQRMCMTSNDGHQVSPEREAMAAAMALHRRRLHGQLLEALDLRRRDVSSLSDAALRAEASTVLHQIIEGDTLLPIWADRARLLDEVVNEAVGLGPLEALLADHRVSEIMVNRHDELFIEVEGRLRRHPACFSSEQAVREVMERIVAPLGRRIDESSPMVDARLPDGSRVNAVIAPIALRGNSLTIRKFPDRRLGMQDLVSAGSLSADMSMFLAACVRARKNIVVSGGTGSGKTTLLNILSNCIADGERVITIEDAAELRLEHPHLVALEARPANTEGRGQVKIRDLVRNALRMRPDRIVIGECRGEEAFDMLAAMNTGHEGSLTTLHANSPRDALARLETMVLMAGMSLPLSAVREHISASIDFIVQQSRLGEGRRLVTSIVEVTGMESGRIQTQEVFRFRPGPPPGFEGCGVVPECFRGSDGLVSLSVSMFENRFMPAWTDSPS